MTYLVPVPGLNKVPRMTNWRRVKANCHSNFAVIGCYIYSVANLILIPGAGGLGLSATWL